MKHAYRSSIRRIGIAALAAMGTQMSSAQVFKPLDAVVVNTPSRPVPVSIVGAARTHLSVPVEDHVMLVALTGTQTGCTTAAAAFYRLKPDGTAETTPFTVPVGRTFVVLDVDAVLSASIAGGSIAGFPVGYSVMAAVITASNTNTGLYMAHTTNGVTITQTGIASVAVSSAMTSGVIFGSGQQPCMRADVRGPGGGFNPDHRVTNGSMRGYLL